MHGTRHARKSPFFRHNARVALPLHRLMGRRVEPHLQVALVSLQAQAHLHASTVLAERQVLESILEPVETAYATQRNQTLDLTFALCRDRRVR